MKSCHHLLKPVWLSVFSGLFWTSTTHGHCMFSLHEQPQCEHYSKCPFVFHWRKSFGRMRVIKWIISENRLTLNSEWPWVCRKLSSSWEKVGMASIRVSSDILCGFGQKWRKDLSKCVADSVEMEKSSV